MKKFRLFLTLAVLALLPCCTAAFAQSYTLTEGRQNTSSMQSASWQGFSYIHSVNVIDQIQTLSMGDIPATKVKRNASVPASFTALGMEGYVYTNRPGEPMLPLILRQIELPQGAAAKVVIAKAEYQDIDLKLAGYPAPLLPVQAPRSKSAKGAAEFSYKAEAYAVDAFSAEPVVEVVEQGTLRHLRIANLYIRPFNYNPATHTLRVYTQIEFNVEFEGADKGATEKMHRLYGGAAFKGVESTLLNPLPVSKAKSASYESPVRYVIVSDPMFKETLRPFVEWKTTLGYEIIEAYTGEDVSRSKEAILAYLKGLYENATEEAPAPVFALFVGDLAQIPTKEYGTQSYWDDPHVSDLYLCEFTGDRFPDMYYGRMSATTVAQLEPQIEKVLYMEGISYEKASFLDTAFIIAGVDGNFGLSHLNPTVDYIYNNYMSGNKPYAYKYPYPSSGSASSDIIANINAGVGVGIYTAHGDWNEWYEPNINVNDVNNRFTNAGKYPLLVGNCCLTGKFDKPACFGETLLRKKDAGAAVYIGCSNVSYFDEDVYWEIGLTTLDLTNANANRHTYENTGLGANDAYYHTHGEPYEKWCVNASEMIYMGNMAVEAANSSLNSYYWEIYHVFGDPSYMPASRRPEPIDAQYSSMIILGRPTFEVNTRPYARVALSANGELYGVATADENGVAQVPSASIHTPGMYTLCITAQNGIAYFDEVAAGVPGPKYIIASKAVVLDKDGEEAKTLRYGQTYNLKLKLENVGSQPVSNALLKISGINPYLNFTSTEYEYTGTLNPGVETEMDRPFTFTVSADVPDAAQVSYDLEIVPDGEADGTSTVTYKYKVAAADLQLVSFVIDDAQAENPNGVLDNSETVKARFVFRNGGSVAATDVTAEFAVDLGFVVVDAQDARQNLGTIEASAERNVKVVLSAPNSWVIEEPYQILITTNTVGRMVRDTVKSFLQAATETFESGDFQYAHWQNGLDDTPWVIDDSCVYKGKYSAASGRIGNNAASTLGIEVDLPMDDAVGFHYMLSTERVSASMGDFLCFYIDDVRMTRLGGIQSEWKYLDFNLNAGPHTLKWVYQKDGSSSEGADRVWIDDIRLPFGTWVQNLSNRSYRAAAPALTMSVMKASRGRLTLSLQGSREQRGTLYLLTASGLRVSVLDHALRVDATRRSVSYTLPELPSGLYLCVFEAADGSRSAVKFVY